jgi:hypothetical protein
MPCTIEADQTTEEPAERTHRIANALVSEVSVPSHGMIETSAERRHQRQI